MHLPFLLMPLLASLASGSPQGETPDLRCTPDNTSDSTSLLHLVNKSDETTLHSGWAPTDLVKLPKHYLAPGARGTLRREAADALSRMLETGKALGHKIRVRSAFRSYEKQRRIFKNKSKRYGLAKASRVSARAGHSQHQLGTTIDIVLPRYRNRITQRIAKSPEINWLRDNAHHFGFALSYPRGKEALTGYMYEPWHYRYVGVAAATEMWQRDMPMESYLRACQGDRSRPR